MMKIDKFFDTLQILESFATLSAQFGCSWIVHSINNVFSDTHTLITLEKGTYTWMFRIGMETSSFRVCKEKEQLCDISFESECLVSGKLHCLLILTMLFYTQDSTEVLLTSVGDVEYLSENSLMHTVPKNEIEPLIHKLRQRWNSDATYETMGNVFPSLVTLYQSDIAV